MVQAKKVGVTLSQEEALSLSGFGDKTKLSDNLGTYLTTRTESDKKLVETKASIRNDTIEILKSEGYTVAANDPNADKFYTAREKAIRENISNMETEAARIADSRGRDSEEYKNIAKQVLDAKAEFGGYGVIKTNTGYKVAGAGDVDGSTMVMASKTGGYTDPVTGTLHVYIAGTADTPENFVQKRLDETGYVNGTSMKYASAFSIGESATPPEGGGSYFGQGSGSTAGGGDTGSEILNKLGSFSPLAVSDGSGKSYAETSNGFALITLGDGRTVAVNQNDPEDVVWLTADQLKQYQDKAVTTKTQVTQPTPIKTIDEIRQNILDQIKAGAVTGTGVTTGEGSTTGVNQGTGGVDTTADSYYTSKSVPRDSDSYYGTTPPTDTTTTTADSYYTSKSVPRDSDSYYGTTDGTDTTTPPTNPPTGRVGDIVKPPTSGGTKPTMPTGGVGDIVKPTPEQLQQRQQRTNQLMSLLGLGGGGQQQQQINVKAPELAKINYIYDISGPSIFAGPQGNSLYGTETGTVDDLQKIMKG
jgi:hypothetical protein